MFSVDSYQQTRFNDLKSEKPGGYPKTNIEQINQSANVCEPEMKTCNESGVHKRHIFQTAWKVPSHSLCIHQSKANRPQNYHGDDNSYNLTVYYLHPISLILHPCKERHSFFLNTFELELLILGQLNSGHGVVLLSQTHLLMLSAKHLSSNRLISYSFYHADRKKQIHLLF